MQGSRSNLNNHWDCVFELSTQKLLCGIELAHGPDSRNQNTAVMLGNSCDLGILTDSNQDWLSAKENYDEWNHNASYDETAPIVENSTVVSHLPSV